MAAPTQLVAQLLVVVDAAVEDDGQARARRRPSAGRRPRDRSMIASRRWPERDRPVGPDAAAVRAPAGQPAQHPLDARRRRPPRPSKRISPASPHMRLRPSAVDRSAVRSGSPMIQVSFAPPPREEFTTMLPGGATRVSARSASVRVAGAGAAQVDEGAQVDVPRLEAVRRRASGAWTARPPPGRPRPPGRPAISARRAATSAAVGVRADQHARRRRSRRPAW